MATTSNAKVNSHQNYTLTSKDNFWVPSLLAGYSSFPVKLCSSDYNKFSLDALQLSAVSPLFHRILDDAYVSSQCSWSSDNFAVIFPDSDHQIIMNFIRFITYGDCEFKSNEEMEEVKTIIKCLSVKFPPLYTEDDDDNHVECHIDIKEEGEESDDELMQESQSSNASKPIVSDEKLKNEPKDVSEKQQIEKLSKSESSFTCEYCNGSVGGEKDSWSYMLHMSTHVGTKALECIHCKFVLRNQNDWKNHMEGEAGVKKRKACCGICGEVFLGQWNFLVHKRDAHDGGKPIQCETCNAVISDAGGWKYHKSDHAKVMCQVCGLSMNKSALKKHMKVQHLYDPQKDAKPCRICGKVFMHEYNRQLHEKTVHTNQGNKVCDLCGKTFKSTATLRNHVDVIHMNNSKRDKLEKIHSCKLCGKAFKTKTEMAYHEKRHNASGFFKCEFCDKHFGTDERLKHHVKDYHSKIKFVCLVCGKQFCVISHAKRHCLNHNTAKIKSYQCEMCLEWFENSDIAATHIKHFHSAEQVKPTIRHRMTDEFQQLMKSVIREIF